MAGSSSRASMSPTLKRENGSSSFPGGRSPMSPGGSDFGSIASATPSRNRADRSYNSPSRLGNLHGAGLSSLQLALGEASSSSSSKSGLTGFNAISTLLNDPKRPQRAIDPSSSRYPAISQSHTDLPKVKRADFEGYITSTKKEWERFQRNLRLGSRGKARLEADDVESDTKTQSIDRTPNSSDPSEVDHTAIIGKKKLPPLSTVPQVFFAEDFDLGNPYTFDLVTERYKAAGGAGSARNGSAVSPNGGYDVALNQMLQEKLSYYSDVVEQHLILEISARSTSFFAALGNLQDLESEAAHCLKRVESLKSELEDKEEGIAKAGLRVIREQAKRREIVERLEAVGILQMLCEKKDLCRLLVQSGEWSEALDVMDLLRNVVLGKEKLQSATSTDSSLPPHVDLDFTSIASVNAFLPQLDEMKEAISTQLQSDLMSILSQDLQNQIGEPDHMDVSPITKDGTAAVPTSANGILRSEASRLSAPSTPMANTAEMRDITDLPASSEDLALQGRISAHLHGLVRTQGIDVAINMYRDMALKTTRKTMRTYLCQCKIMQANESRDDLASLLEDDEAATGKPDAKWGPGGAEAASKLREMAHLSFLELTRSILMGLSRSIQCVSMQTRAILRVLSEAGKAETENGNSMSIMMPQGVSPSLPGLLASIVSDVGGLTHVLSSRLLSLRSSSHINLPLSDFLDIFHLCWSFVLESESTCNRMIIGLRGVVLNQAKAWLANFHRIRIERAARAVEEEKWNQAESSTEQQKLIELIIGSATADPPSLVVKVASEANASSDEQKESSEGALNKTLLIEERQYFVVGATLDILDMLVEYLKVVINLPLLSTETMGRVVEFAKQFNSRTCQVVLGAGAMRSAGLSNITAKHLALASQSLSVMITLIPYVRETVRRHLSPKQAVMLIEFDKLKRDYQEHQFEIHSKLVAIMSDRLTVHCRGMSNVQWNIDGQSTDPVKPAADLAKETTTLYKVLCRYLQASVVELVIGQVLTAIDKRVSAELRKVEVKEEAALQKMNVVKSFFDERFGSLKNVEWSTKELEEVIEEQKVSLEKHKVASVPPPPAHEKKDTVPAYKPRINIFGRKNLATPSTPPSARASLDVAPEKSDVEAAIPDARPQAVAETATVKEAEVEAEVKTNEEAPSTPTKPSVPAKEDLAGETAPPTPIANGVVQAPSPPEKDKEEGTQINGAAPAIKVEGSDVILPSAPSSQQPSRSHTPIIPSAPSTPVRGAQESITSPTPGRMTLQQRLAEAARKRAQGGASRRSATSEAPSSGVATPIRSEGEAVVSQPPSSSTASQGAEVQKATIVDPAVEPVIGEPSTDQSTEPTVEAGAESAAESTVEPTKDEILVPAVESPTEPNVEGTVEESSESVNPHEETDVVILPSEAVQSNIIAEEENAVALQVEEQEASTKEVPKVADEKGETVEAAQGEGNAVETILEKATAESDAVAGGAVEEAKPESNLEAENAVDDSMREKSA